MSALYIYIYFNKQNKFHIGPGVGLFKKLVKDFNNSVLLKTCMLINTVSLICEYIKLNLDNIEYRYTGDVV